jgi:hypothetical protein
MPLGSGAQRSHTCSGLGRLVGGQSGRPRRRDRERLYKSLGLSERRDTSLCRVRLVKPSLRDQIRLI